MQIRFTQHAEEKLTRLTGVGVTRDKVKKTVIKPDKLEQGYAGRKIAQSGLSSDLILRVVYEQTEEEILIITVYPGRQRRYG